jgi:type II secretory pathway pseudopilin PulG
MTGRGAFSLLELALVILILGTVAAIAMPSAARARDTLAVRAARTELLGAFSAVRLTALRAGGAALVIDPAAGEVRIEAPAARQPVHSYPLAARYGVTIATDRPAPVSLRYDGLGIGRLTNVSIRLERRQASAVVIVSAYGRVRS